MFRKNFEKAKIPQELARNFSLFLQTTSMDIAVPGRVAGRKQGMVGEGKLVHAEALDEPGADLMPDP
jgi:hypothetical protein